jgi:hypothetical protein
MNGGIQHTQRPLKKREGIGLTNNPNNLKVIMNSLIMYHHVNQEMTGGRNSTRHKPTRTEWKNRKRQSVTSRHYQTGAF